MALVRWNRGGGRVPTGQDPRDDGECFYDEDLWPAARARRLGLGRRAAQASFLPRVDLIDTVEAVVVRADVPGLEKEDLDITIANDVVTIKGERKDDLASKVECEYCRETASGSFERQIQLPETVLNDKAEARLKNGVLTLTIPKAEPKGAVKIPVS